MRSSAEGTPDHYRPDVDGLRAVAILAVVAFHAAPSLIPGGFVGVDVFFVISGYLITSILLRELAAGEFSLASFYARRVRRLFPALTLLLIVALAAGWFYLLSVDYRDLGFHVAAGAGFVSNLLLWREAGYFDTAAGLKPLLHLWSLGVEEQFYLVWPLLLVLARRWRWRIGAAIAAVGFGSFVYDLASVASEPVSAFYLPQARFWELMVGAAIAASRVQGDFRRLGARGSNLLALFGGALLALALALVDPNRAFPGWWATAPVFGAAALLIAGPAAWFNSRVLSGRIMVWIGLISYPLYLWHWTILSFANRLAGPAKTPTLIRYRLAALVLSLLLAWLTHAIAERRAAALFRRSPRGTVASLCGALGLVGIAGLLHFPPQTPGLSIARQARLSVFAARSHTDGWRRGACFFLPNETPDEIAAFSNNQCDGGQNPRRPVILLAGDSTAAHLVPGLDAKYAGKATIAQLTDAACPLLENITSIGTPSSSPRCRAFNRYVFTRAAALRPRVIVVGAYFLAYESDPRFAYPNFDSEFVGSVRRLHHVSGAPVIVVGQSPVWTEGLPNAVGRYLRNHGTPLPTSLSEGLDPRAFATDAALRDLDWGPGVAYVSLLDTLCAGGACRVTVEGEFPDNLIGYDTEHFSEAGSRFVVDSLLAPWIDRRLGETRTAP